MNIEELKQKYCHKMDLLDLELIISRVIKKPREFVIAHPEYEIVESQKVHKVKSQIKRRMAGKPLAYILGEKEFYGLNFKVNKNVLVPRPETELIIEEALNKIKQESKKARKQENIFIDVGTGSGCIIITLAKKLKSYKLVGTDISGPALRVARQNARLHKIDKKIKFLHGNLLEPIYKKSKIINQKSKIIITANLPYLTPAQIKNSPSIQHEPKLALAAGKDGLKYYRRLFKQIKMLRVMCYVLCEIDPSQASKIKKIIKDDFPSAKIEIKKDLKGFDRLVAIDIN